MVIKMNEIYYNLSLRTKQKSPKVVKMRSQNYDLSCLNSILNSILKKLRVVKSDKRKTPVKVLKLLDKIIPDEYFGIKQNRKLFYRIVKNILTQSYMECMYSSTLVKGHNYDAIPWLNDVSDVKTCQIFLKKANYFLLEEVVKPLITFYYRPVKTYSGNKIEMIRLENWTSFETRIFNELRDSGVLVESEDSKIKARGYLKIIPKGFLQEYKYRAIVDSFKTDKNLLKSLISNIYQAAKEKNSHFSNSPYDDWSTFVRNVGDKKIYGIKLDIKDAYGNVDVSLLLKIISAIPSKFFKKEKKVFLEKYLNSQLVLFRGKVYKWTHGLLQGDALSACLCELYMSHLDKTFLPSVEQDSFMHRTVDDYFFCSTEQYKVANFANTIRNIHKVNEAKTKTNLTSEEPCEEIPYCGKIFNLATKQVKTSFNFEKRYEIRHRFKLWNIFRPIPENNYQVFILKALSFSCNNNFFSKFELNTVFNTQRTVLENFYDGMVYVAYKFDVAVMAVRDNLLTTDFNFVPKVLENSIGVYLSKAVILVKTYRGRFSKREIGFKLLRALAYRAFIAVLKRRNEIYKNLIQQIESTNNLKISFPYSNLDFKYFGRLPEGLRHVKINRKNVL